MREKLREMDGKDKAKLAVIAALTTSTILFFAFFFIGFLLQNLIGNLIITEEGRTFVKKKMYKC